MATQKINTLPNTELEKLSNQFNYYALANLGQRFGVAGDSVTTSNFTWGDLINYNTNVPTATRLGYVKYYKNKIELGTINKETSVISIKGQHTIENINEYIKLTSQISLPDNFRTNNVDYYAEGSYVGYHVDTDTYYFSAIGYFNENGNAKKEEYIFYCIKGETGEIVDAVKVVNAPYDKNGNINLTYNTINSFSPTVFRLVNNNIYNTDEVYNTYSLISYKINNTDLSMDSIINAIVDEKILPNLENLWEMSEDTNIENGNYGSVIINDIIAGISSVDITEKTICTGITFDTNKSQQFAFPDNADILDAYEHYIEHFAHDLTYVCKEFISYYANSKFTANRDKICDEIFASIVKKVIDDSGRTQPTNDTDFIELYWPIDYVFSYYQKADGQGTHIYGSNQNITVQFSGKNTLSNGKVLLDKITLPTIQVEGITRVSLYSFTCLYYDEDLLEHIYVAKEYTLPYIDSDNYWNINETRTDIVAKGQNGGQPNIIIIYNDYNEVTGEPSPKVIHAANYDEIFSLIDNNNLNTDFWVKDSFNFAFNVDVNKTDKVDNSDILAFDDGYILESKIDNEEDVVNKDNEDLLSRILKLEEEIKHYHPEEEEDDVINIIGNQNTRPHISGNYYSLYTMLPNYSQLGAFRQQLLKNSIIINITNTNNEFYRSSDLEKLTDVLSKNVINTYSPTVTTLWVIGTDNNGNDGYICLENPEIEGIALDFNYIAMVDEYINYRISKYQQVGPDNFTFTQVVFDNIYANLKNNDKANVTIYPNIKTVNTDVEDDNYYAEGTFVDNIYNNPANIAIEFNSYLTGEISKNIEGISQSDELTHYSYINSYNIYTPYIYSANDDTDDKSNTAQYVGTEEYTFNGVMPTVELKEVILRNSNVLNRSNIISLDKEGKMYYSYMGAPYDNPDKSVFHIGSTNKDFSFGTNSISKNNTNFAVQDSLSIDFKYSYIHGITWDVVHNSIYDIYTTTTFINNEVFYDEIKHTFKNSYTLCEISNSEKNNIVNSNLSYINLPNNTTEWFTNIKYICDKLDIEYNNSMKLITNIPLLEIEYKSEKYKVFRFNTTTDNARYEIFSIPLTVSLFKSKQENNNDYITINTPYDCNRWGALIKFTI